MIHILNTSIGQLRALLSIALLFIAFNSFAQPTIFYNDGALIGVDPSTIVWVGGHITNKQNGVIDNKGDIYLTGDWTNEDPNGCLLPTTGTVILDGTAQSIQGTEVTTFNNLTCQGIGVKTLNQNTIVGGTTGTLALQANAFDLNGYTCNITNPLASAITRTSGYMISETLPTSSNGYGLVQWEIGSTVDNYTIPFGTVSGSYIPFIYNVTTAGSTGGNISIGTYPTDVTLSPNNRPLPSGVSNLNNSDGTESAPDVLDRFWIADINNFSTNPTADLTFTYREDEWDAIVGSTNIISEDSLEAWRWDGSAWQNPTIGIANITANAVTANDIDYAGPWTLRKMDSTITLITDCNNLSLPNAFSPNGDGRNDLFSIHGWPSCVDDFNMIIFNRWGQKIYETENVSAYWDGTFKGKSLDPGVYIYYINAKSFTGEDITRKGNISLIK